MIIKLVQTCPALRGSLLTEVGSQKTHTHSQS